jgi:signal transduction histidine kinase
VVTAAAALAEHAFLVDRYENVDVSTVHQVLAATLLVTALAVAISRVGRPIAMRRAVSRLVVTVGQAPADVSLERLLGARLGDPGLRIVYPLVSGGATTWVDAAGSVARPAPGATPLTSAGVTIALVSHRVGLLDDPGTVRALTDAARLRLENERARAGVLAGLRALRESQRRIVADVDATRRRLERDLHDGAQQDLVAAALLLRRDLATADPAARAGLTRAAAAVDRSLSELRALAHGLVPASLVDAGLRAAIDDLLDDVRVPARVAVMVDGRYSATAEATVYSVVASAITAAAGDVEITATEDGRRIVVSVRGDGVGSLDRVDLGDRVGAIGGALTVEDDLVEAAIPCA